MSIREASCPGCGGKLTFTNAATIYVICKFCNSGSWRRDVDLELVGKVAIVSDIDSPFAIGSRGAIGGVSWLIVGQVQLDHGRGPWNEWCLAMGDGTWAWLAEAQGEYIITRAVGEDLDVPKYVELHAGRKINIKSNGTFIIAEVGSGVVTAALGELPVALEINKRFLYADVRGTGSRFGTLDYGSANECDTVYIGNVYSLTELGFDAASSPRRENKQIAAVRFDCPNCGSSVDVRDPARAIRVGCGSCRALLDPRGEKITVLEVAQQIAATPALALGSVGKLRGEEYEIYAFLIRSTKSDGVRYPWREYLIRRRDGAYHWLVESNGHWSLVRPANIGDIVLDARDAKLHDTKFVKFDSGKARVDLVLGEVYWEVAVGETVNYRDLISPPYIISIESSETEVTASQGSYVLPGEIFAAFRPKNPLPEPVGPGVLQPNPFKPYKWRILSIAAIFIIIVIFLDIFFHMRASNRVVYSGTHPARVAATENASAPAEDAAVVFSDEFEIDGDSTNFCMTLACTELNNSWLAVDGSLVNSETGDVHNFSAETSYWYGVEGGETWSEGGFTDRVCIGPIPRGKYTLRLAPSTDSKFENLRYTVEARVGVPSSGRPWIIILLILAGPLLFGIRSAMFEGARWSQGGSD
ncbi:MAG: DUF4178 domain-containing protein [Planctomycetes bacterium]|nr:DUF4178 domain-containing protein [Planctomycetota bacterium]